MRRPEALQIQTLDFVMMGVEPVQDVHVHVIVPLGRELPADDIFGETGDGIVGLHGYLAGHEEFHKSLGEGFDVLVKVIEPDHMTVRDRIAAEIFTYEVDPGIGHRDMLDLRMLFEKIIEDAVYLLRIVRRYEYRMYAALGIMFVDIVHETLPPDLVRVGETA